MDNMGNCCELVEDPLVSQGFCCRRAGILFEGSNCTNPECFFCHATGFCHGGEHKRCDEYTQGGYVGGPGTKAEPCMCPCHGHFPAPTEQELQEAAIACKNLLNQLRRPA